MYKKENIYKIKKEIIKICKFLAKENFMLATDGNISYKISSNKIIITPKQKNKSDLKINDLVVININGKKINGINEPSGEYRLHLMVYKHRKDIKAIIHTHPIFSTVLSVAGISLDKPVLPEAVFMLGEKIPTVEYGTFYTEDLANKVKKYVFSSDVFLLKNHGLLTLGKNLQDVFFKTLKTEQLAKIVCFAKLLGRTNILTKKQILELLKIKQT